MPCTLHVGSLGWGSRKTWRSSHCIEIAQRILKHSDIQYTSLTLDKKLNSLIYRTLFYVNIYGCYVQTSKTVRFLAHPVVSLYWMLGPLISRCFNRWLGLLCVNYSNVFHSCILSPGLLSRSWVKVKSRSKLCEGQSLCHSALRCCLVVIHRIALRRDRWTDFHDLQVIRRVSAQRCAFWGSHCYLCPFKGWKAPKTPFLGK